jgi:phosphoribosyl 1,2-cyclic phosphodiesterase
MGGAMQIKIIASGSTGNAYWISDGKTELLIEAGIPISRLKKGLNFRLSKMDGCLITHEHKDHSKAVLDVLKAGVDVYCTEGTAKALGITGMEWREIFEDIMFRVGTFVITPFATIHDAAEPVGFVIYSLDTFEKILFATDTTDVPIRPLLLTHVMIECNYDDALLQEHLESGTMPERLQNRVEASHLSLERCMSVLSSLNLSLVKAIYLLHLSQHHSDKNRFVKAIQILTGIPTYF